MMSLTGLLPGLAYSGQCTGGRAGAGEVVLPVEAGFPGRQLGAKPRWPDGPRREEERGTSSVLECHWGHRELSDPSGRTV